MHKLMSFKDIFEEVEKRGVGLRELARRSDVPHNTLYNWATKAKHPDRVMRVLSECRKILKEPWQSFGSKRVDSNPDNKNQTLK